MRGSNLFATADGATWLPSQKDLERSRLRAAMESWGYDDVAALHQASVDDPQWFWPAVAADLGIEFSSPFHMVRDDSAGPEFPRWFVGATFNIVDSCVERHAIASYADKPAVCFEGDAGQYREISHRMLAAEVHRVADAFAELGVRKGDCVGLFLPAVPEAAVAFLACARLGAIAVPMFSGYGAGPVADRLNDCAAVLLVTADHTTRRGRPVEMKAIADEALLRAPGVRTVVVVPAGEPRSDAMVAGRDLWWGELQPLQRSAAAERLDPNHPLMIMYTSGTTGRPKGIVHSHVGYLLKAALDFGYAFDLQTDDVLSWIADLGWNLAPLMIVGGLHLGSTIVLIEGVPDYPTPDRIWEIARRRNATVQGLAPTAARILQTQTEGFQPGLPLSLRAFVSTGEAWDSTSWTWLFATVGQRRLPILNYTGGTEVGGGILSGYTILPHRGPSFCGPLLGMDVAVLDPTGDPTVGGPGELALLNTWPGIALGFWHDDERFLSTYWRQFPGTWVHGDLAQLSPDGYWDILGRSDDTMKIAGRRVGPGEVESALLAAPGVKDAAVVGVPDDVRGQRIVAFLVPKDLAALELKVVEEQVAQRIGRSLVPSALHLVSGLPKTKNGKTMRRTIRARYLGEALGDLTALDAATPVEQIPVLTELSATGRPSSGVTGKSDGYGRTT
ncbi:AMP-binding protein [Sporichthya sp.]|uniref:AMP-binding protein n=1 Tax=Sporichthya sp. TaxID=65475 RepID=UPI0017D2F510|nr:AMP-binding protein [Sporichthya sp.]MBA3741431.1 AMP-binding protein [Sporichthya sp.]